jgi:hypothetical protein
LRKNYRNSSVAAITNTNKNTTVSEKTLQSQVVSCLTLLGYTVFETGKARGKSKCPVCGTYSYATGWQGNTLGVPDLYVHNTKWQMPIGIGIELKTKTGAVRKEQAHYANINVTIICRTLIEVINAIDAIEQSIGTDTTRERIKKFKENEWILQ